MPYILSSILTSGAVNYMYAHLVYAVFIVCVYAPLKNKSFIGNFLQMSTFWWLFFFGFFYATIAMPTIQGIFYYLALPVLTYAAGWMIYELSSRQGEVVIRRLIISLLIGFSVHAAFNYVVNIDVPRWLVRDYFTGRIRSATGQGAINTFSMSLVGYWLFIEKKTLTKLIGVTLFIPSALFMLQLGTRTQLLILCVCLVATILMYLALVGRRSTAIRLVVVLMLLMVIGGIAYTNDTLGFRKMIESSTLFARMDEQQSSGQMEADQYRVASVFDGIVSLLENPMGIERESRFHNMWLDVGRMAGWLPFFALVAFSGIVLTHMLRLVKNRRFSIEFRCMIFGVMLGIYLNFCTEPIVEGLMDFFLAHLLLIGAIEAFYNSSMQQLCMK